MNKTILFAIAIILVGCSTFGTTEKQTMMQKWLTKKHTVALLDDINGWCNWVAKGEAFERGKCGEQTEAKISILKELNISAKIMHCEITRDDPYHPTSHAFVVAHIDGKNYIMDNGAVQDVVWDFEAVKKSAWGVKFNNN